MSYNLLLDSNFQNNNWNFINCSLQDGKLISTKKVFGIEQDLTLPDSTRLYFRCNYLTEEPDVREVKIGIQNKDILNVDIKFPRVNKWQHISVIDEAKQKNIKLHVIFESDKDVNEVQIKEPILVDLNHLGRATWLKVILDRTISYVSGYAYKNEYKEIVLSETNHDFKDCKVEGAKCGVIISEKEKKEIELDAKFIVNKYYLAKLNFEEINQFGNIRFKYGVLKSTRDNEQIYLVFKARENEKLKLEIESTDGLPYQINLKNLLLIDITKLRLLNEDIPYLPFV